MIEIIEGIEPKVSTYPDGHPKSPRSSIQRMPDPAAVGGDLDAWLAANFLPPGVEKADKEVPEHWHEVDDVELGRVRVTPGTTTTELVKCFGFSISEPATGVELLRVEPSHDTPDQSNKDHMAKRANRTRDALHLDRPRDEVLAELDAKVQDMSAAHARRLEEAAAVRDVITRRSG